MCCVDVKLWSTRYRVLIGVSTAGAAGEIQFSAVSGRKVFKFNQRRRIDPLGLCWQAYGAIRGVGCGTRGADAQRIVSGTSRNTPLRSPTWAVVV